MLTLREGQTQGRILTLIEGLGTARHAGQLDVSRLPSLRGQYPAALGAPPHFSAEHGASKRDLMQSNLDAQSTSTGSFSNRPSFNLSECPSNSVSALNCRRISLKRSAVTHVC